MDRACPYALHLNHACYWKRNGLIFDSASDLLPGSVSTTVLPACIAQVRKNPSAYGIPGGGLSESAVERVLKDQLILSNVSELAKYRMVRCCSYIYVTCKWCSGPWRSLQYLLGWLWIALHDISVNTPRLLHCSGHDKYQVLHMCMSMFPMHKEGGKKLLRWVLDA